MGRAVDWGDACDAEEETQRWATAGNTYKIRGVR